MSIRVEPDLLTLGILNGDIRMEYEVCNDNLDDCQALGGSNPRLR